MRNFAILSITLLTLSSCASNIHRGVVAMKLNDRTAHIGLNNNEVKEGDHVELYANKCPPSSQRTKTYDLSCQKIHKGHGVVTKVLNENYSEVVFDEGVSFEEGNFIEKHSH